MNKSIFVLIKKQLDLTTSDKKLHFYPDTYSFNLNFLVLGSYEYLRVQG